MGSASKFDAPSPVLWRICPDTKTRFNQHHAARASYHDVSCNQAIHATSYSLIAVVQKKYIATLGCVGDRALLWAMACFRLASLGEKSEDSGLLV